MIIIICKSIYSPVFILKSTHSFILGNWDESDFEFHTHEFDGLFLLTFASKRRLKFADNCLAATCIRLKRFWVIRKTSLQIGGRRKNHHFHSVQRSKLSTELHAKLTLIYRCHSGLYLNDIWCCRGSSNELRF